MCQKSLRAKANDTELHNFSDQFALVLLTENRLGYGAADPHEWGDNGQVIDFVRLLWQPVD